jgi:hypothetical protein
MTMVRIRRVLSVAAVASLPLLSLGAAGCRSAEASELAAAVGVGQGAEEVELGPCTSANPMTKPGVCQLHGKVKVVNAFPKYKVKVVTAFPDIKVQKVNAFPDGPGKWQFVDSFPDFTIQFVDAFPDFTVQYVNAFPGCN